MLNLVFRDSKTKTPHRYHPDAKKEIDRRLDSILARGRNPVPRRVRFATWTLRYNQMNWVTVDGQRPLSVS